MQRNYKNDTYFALVGDMDDFLGCPTDDFLKGRVITLLRVT